MTGALTRLGNASTILDTLSTPAERAIGYRNLPLTAQRAAAATIALTDMGMAVPITTGGITVPANATVAFPIEAVVLVLNNGTSAQTITPAPGVTLILAGTSATGARSVAANGIASLWKIATDTWMVSGVGVA